VLQSIGEKRKKLFRCCKPYMLTPIFFVEEKTLMEKKNPFSNPTCLPIFFAKKSIDGKEKPFQTIQTLHVYISTFLFYEEERALAKKENLLSRGYTTGL